MRIRNLVTIRNEYAVRVCYWVFTANDTSYWSALNGNMDWLEPGQSKEVQIAPLDAQIGFRKGNTVFDGWYASPAKIKTDRDVALSAKSKITQPDHSQWDMPDQGATVVFMDEAQKNNIARQIVMWGTGKIPEVGGFISSVIGFLWEEIKPDVDDLITASEMRMKAWVHGQIAQYDRDLLKHFLIGLHTNMDTYIRMKDPASKMEWMNNCLGHFNMSQAFFTKQDYTLGTLAMGFDLATLHISLLRERVLFADQLGIAQVDRPGNAEELTKVIKLYQDFVHKVAIPAELQWRKDQIAVSTSNIDILGGQSIIISDHSVRQVQGFSAHPYGRTSNNIQYQKEIYLRQAASSVEMAMQANVGDPARLWTRLDPSQADSRPIDLDRTSWVGPCSGLIYKKGNEHDASKDVKLSTTGRIIGIDIRAANEVDYIRLRYDDGREAAIGAPQNGRPNSVELPDGVYVTRVDTWWDWELVAIQFYLSDGTKTAQFGNDKKTGYHHQVASLEAHMMTGIQLEGSHAASVGSAMSVAFQPAPGFYDHKAD